MKRFTLIFSLMMTMFTAAMAQESVDFSTGTLDGQWGDKETRSIWTSANGLQIVSTDANGNEVGSMKYYSNRFTLYINEGVATPIKYTITVPEGYSLTEMKVKNSTKSHDAHIDYDWSSYSLYNTTAEKTIQFVEGVNEFFLYGQVGRTIYVTSLTITKTGGEETGINEVKGENDEVKAIYDLTGRRINEIAGPGIYIVGGKKVFVK
ncbi:MAG: hypothetical protein IIW75_07795 [Bacteroidaceae bacterium]|nr:hypothetical protein [Bacteroidaceae bacterium]